MADPRARTTRVLVVGGIAMAVAVALIVAGRANRPDVVESGTAPVGAEAPAGVERFVGLSQDHVQGIVDYPQVPPVGGPHAGTWQNCGAYDEPVTSELAVHSMEHGAVWITFRGDLDRGSVDRIEQVADDEPYVLTSPWAGEEPLPAPIVASAWGRQLQIDSTDGEELSAFVRAFAQGEQTPEPGAPCTGCRSRLRATSRRCRTLLGCPGRSSCPCSSGSSRSRSARSSGRDCRGRPVTRPPRPGSPGT